MERKFGDVAWNIDHACDLIRRVSATGTTILALPELATTGYFPRKPFDASVVSWAEPIPGPATDQFAEVALAVGVTLIVPLFERDGPRLFNAAAVIAPSGLVGTYRKRHIPSIRPPGMYEAQYFERGDLGYPVFRVDNVAIGVSICYDRHFPEVYRLLAFGGVEVVFSVNNSGSPRSRRMWEPEIQAACSSNGIFAVQVNAVGEEEAFFGSSFVCDPEGRVVCGLPDSAEGVLIREIDLDEIARAREHYRAIEDTDWSDYGVAVATQP